MENEDPSAYYISAAQRVRIADQEAARLNLLGMCKRTYMRFREYCAHRNGDHRDAASHLGNDGLKMVHGFYYYVPGTQFLPKKEVNVNNVLCVLIASAGAVEASHNDNVPSSIERFYILAEPRNLGIYRSLTKIHTQCPDTGWRPMNCALKDDEDEDAKLTFDELVSLGDHVQSARISGFTLKIAAKQEGFDTRTFTFEMATPQQFFRTAQRQSGTCCTLTLRLASGEKCDARMHIASLHVLAGHTAPRLLDVCCAEQPHRGVDESASQCVQQWTFYASFDKLFMTASRAQHDHGNKDYHGDVHDDNNGRAYGEDNIYKRIQYVVVISTKVDEHCKISGRLRS